MEPNANLPALPQPPSPLGDLVVRTGRMAGARRALTAPLTLIGQAAGSEVRLNVEDVLAYRELRAARRREQLRELTELSEQVEGGYR